MSLPEALAALGRPRARSRCASRSTAFALDYQVTGRFGECLDRLKDRLADPVGDRVVEGLRIAREVGGGELGRLLRNLSGFLRDDARTRSELESRQAWTVNGARLAVAAPWLVLLMLCFQPEVIRRYASPAGVVVLAVGGGALRRRLPADGADRPAARPSGGSCRDARRRGVRCSGPVPALGLLLVVDPGAGAPPSAARPCACCPTSATCRRPTGRWRRRPRRPARSAASSARCSASRRAGSSSGCSAAPRPSAAGSSAPASTMTVHEFRVEQVLWGLVGFARRRGVLRVLVAAAATRRGRCLAAGALRWSRSRSACCCATTG